MNTPRQRLVVCLDGTWNNRDDSTNVSHHYDLAINDDLAPGAAGEVCQLLYYDEGVGNGLLDGVTGGGFGIGLEENVREAYNWLVEHFNDSGEGKSYVADDIFVFGFSRGAYTARSLVGFIGRCGLLRRGSPISVKQLWQAYCLLGREREQRRSAWDHVATERPPFRQLSELASDPWAMQPRLPGILSPTEELLVAWSRRVRITYLGVYDTVGAMGLDALAIPGVRSHVALHHNMRPTTLIQNCRHALAIHENRASFQHTPFVAYYGSSASEDELVRGLDEDERRAAETKWKQARAMWRRKIDQRWFVGAHSNIGGGYDCNTLAQAPFRWLLEGACDAGLVLKSDRPVATPACPSPHPTDSYARFAAPFAMHLLRLKRRYRAIVPSEALLAGEKPREAFALETIYEAVHPSVAEYYEKYPDRPLPPNLYAHVQRAAPSEVTRPLLSCPLEPHAWPPGKGGGALWTACWGAFAATGLGACAQFFAPHPLAFPLWLGLAAAFGFVFVDWLESRLNHALAAGTVTPGREPAAQATRDAVYWTRALGVVFAVVGIGVMVAKLWLATRNPGGGCDWLRPDECPFARWSMAALAGAAAVVASALLDRRRDANAWFALSAVPLGLAAALIVPLAGRALLALLGIAPQPNALPASHSAIAGPLLLLWLALGYLVRSFAWVGEPMGSIRLPSIVALQFAWRPRALLDDWHSRLLLSWRDDATSSAAALRRLHSAIREALWRDIVGFVPVYGAVLGFGFWLFLRWTPWAPPPLDWMREAAFTVAGFSPPRGVVLLLALAAGADWIEDAIHLFYLRQHAAKRDPARLVVIAALAATVAKFVGFISLVLGTLGAVACGTWRLVRHAPHVDLRGAAALAIAVGVFTALVLALAAWVRALSVRRGAARA
ncbi:MAG: DUF2235 domain-containing protein [Opitutae bacterium]|nr:DUF2235 domain-containing protein [Opitutae bacterium]